MDGASTGSLVQAISRISAGGVFAAIVLVAGGLPLAAGIVFLVLRRLFAHD